MNKVDDFIPAHSTEADRQVDTALHLLRDASPLPGFETRVRQRLARSRETAQPSPFRWKRAALMAPVVAASLFVVFLLANRGVRHANTPTPFPSARVGGPEGLPARYPHPGPPSSTKAHGGYVPVSAGRPSFALHAGASRPTTRILVRTLAPARESIAAALPETAFDHPAPDLPLTAQELLLVRIAYGNRPPQVASLKRFILPHTAEDEPDFDKFFEPYTTPLTEGNPQ